jgi:CRP-like cAMP-binding protein
MTPHELILHNIAKHVVLAPAEQAHFLSLLTAKKIKKKQFLLRENEVCRNSAFVVLGCLRGYTVDTNGFEHILQFAPPDWWIADMYSLISGLPGHLNIDALEDTEVLLLSKKKQEKLYYEIPKFERFFRIITENSLVANRQRVIDNLSLSAQQRYEQFCGHYPTLINRLPQKQVAAYIGVTPEFLSKMRGDLQRKK